MFRHELFRSFRPLLPACCPVLIYGEQCGVKYFILIDPLSRRLLYPQKQTLVERIAMSALCQKRTFCAAERTSLFDQLVGGRKQRLRHGETERLGGFEIDH